MSIGIIIFGILAVIYFGYIFTIVVIPIVYYHTANMITVTYCITAVGGLVFGVGVLKRLAWARGGLIFLAVIYIADSVEFPSWIFSAIKSHDVNLLTRLIADLTFLVSMIIFFTRPKVKQLFVKNEIKDDHYLTVLLPTPVPVFSGSAFFRLLTFEEYIEFLQSDLTAESTCMRMWGIIQSTGLIRSDCRPVAEQGHAKIKNQEPNL